MFVRSSCSRAGWLLCTAVMAGSLCAQGPITKERWTFAQLEESRRTLLDECREREDDVLRAVTEELLSNSDGERFRPVLRALARVRGQHHRLQRIAWASDLRSVRAPQLHPHPTRPLSRMRVSTWRVGRLLRVRQGDVGSCEGNDVTRRLLLIAAEKVPP